jgi:hypothetical protein
MTWRATSAGPCNALNIVPQHTVTVEVALGQAVRGFREALIGRQAVSNRGRHAR